MMKQYPTILEELMVYSQEIIDGNIIACDKHRKACTRFLRDLERMENDDGFPYYWDEQAAQKIVKWYKRNKHSKGVLTGQPIILDSYQKFIVCNVEAWRHEDTEYRRFKYVYNQVARKNAKSQIEGGQASYEISARGLKAAEVYTLGVERDQALIVFNEIDLMISKPIRKRLNITKKEISHKKSKSFIKHLSKRAGKTGDGKNPQLVIVDEYHAHPTSEMYDVMTSGFGAREEPLIIIITTAGFDFENKPCYKEYKYCSDILDGIIDNDEYFVIICELDEGDDPKDETVWPKANPVLTSYPVGRAFLKRECKKAYESGDEEKIRNFLTKNCNIWLKHGDNKYVNIDYWNKCRIEEEILEKFRGCECYAAFDLSKTGDLTSLSFEFPFEIENIRMYGFHSHSWIPIETMREKMKTDKIPYDFWIESGWLTATEANQGLIVDYWAMINYFEDIVECYDLKVKLVGYDAHNANLLVAELERRGYELVQIPQSCAKLDEPTVNLRDLMKVGQVVHDGNKLLTWSLNNAVTDTNSFGEIKISKKSTFKRIDPAATCIFAHKLGMGHWKGTMNLDKYRTEDYLNRLYGGENGDEKKN